MSSKGMAPNLVEALRALPTSGQHSFEAPVRDLLFRLTGLRFTLVKAGPQGGSNMRNDADDAANVIAVDGKRCGTATLLPLTRRWALFSPLQRVRTAGLIVGFWNA